MDGVAAEQLIALEAAVAELGNLYAAATRFTALRQPAETALLPQLTSLARRLRTLLRAAQLGTEEIEQAAGEIHSLRSEWHARLEQLRASPLYQRARRALADDRQDALAHLLPQVLAGLTLVASPPDLYFPVSPVRAGRRGGSSPFLSVGECADRLVAILRDGVACTTDGSEWWEGDWPSITCAETPAVLDSPIAVCLPAAHVHGVNVFSVVDEAGLRIFAPQLRGPFSITLASAATDQWWEAYDESYQTFRDALQRELTARGHVVTIADIAGASDS